MALYPVGGPYLDPTTFFQNYLAGPIVIFLYFLWKGYSWFARPEHRPLYIKIKNIDIYSGMRQGQADLLSGPDISPERRKESIIELQQERKRSPKDWIMAGVRTVI